ncbi:hypothetical protein APE01nite_14710 [Acetobacter peroxydans]|uniref:Uncharacterized protein n=1 Tax=Acetobacter peroxydans TaxID=104098 RepID=A0A4Y3TVA1_9PROT|nr:hypothetical protein AA0475_0720 [Acetobacter peroxydans]GEB85674.1 hypothetical protein APE01nite_14710 [Acetobacter peroxydans]
MKISGRHYEELALTREMLTFESETVLDPQDIAKVNFAEAHRPNPAKFP